MTKYYTLEAVEKLAERYIAKDGTIVVTRVGTLLDDMIMFGDNLKTVVVTAVYLNSQSSAYTARAYNSTPKKYLKFTN